MSSADNKRGALAALAGLGLQALLAGLIAVIWILSGSTVPLMVLLLLPGGLAIWLVSAILFYCRHMAEVEAREMAQLAADRGSETIFGEEIAELRLAQRRLRWMERFLVPVLTLLLAGYNLAIAAMLLWRWVLPGRAGVVQSPRDVTWGLFCAGGAFLAFLFSRYAVGMSKNAVWRLLRAGGSFMTLSAAAAFLAGVVLITQHAGIRIVHTVTIYLIPAVMTVIAAELLLNFVLDFYRPRIEGVEHRPSFDSRLTNLLSEPGSIAHSIAEALNYQFGFEVSSTWFYKLLQKALLPLLLLGAASLLAISSVVLVGPGQQALVLTWGQVPPADQPPLGPGLHLKWPWPVQTADVVSMKQIRSLRIGVGGERKQEEVAADKITVNGEELLVYVWGREHGEHYEYDLLAARADVTAGQGRQETSPETVPAEAETAPARRASASAAAAVSYIRIVADVLYHVTDLRQFLYGSVDDEDVLAKVGNAELVRFVAQHDVDSLLANQRENISRHLKAAINAEADRLGLGLEVVDVLVQGIHPPTGLADAFEAATNADRAAVGERLTAQAKAEQTLSQAAGSSEGARMLAERLRAIRRAEQAGSAEAVQAAADEADRFFDRTIGGQAKALVNEALASRWERVNAERDRVEAFEKQVTSYAQAPYLYELEKKLDVVAEAVKDAYKYVLGIDPAGVEIRYDHQHPRAIGGALPLGEETAP